MRKMQVKTAMRYFTSHLSEWPPSKNLQKINAGEGVEGKGHGGAKVDELKSWYTLLVKF